MYVSNGRLLVAVVVQQKQPEMDMENLLWHALSPPPFVVFSINKARAESVLPGLLVQGLLVLVLLA